MNNAESSAKIKVVAKEFEKVSLRLHGGLVDGYKLDDIKQSINI
jgi:hypothetical protein